MGLRCSLFVGRWSLVLTVLIGTATAKAQCLLYEPFFGSTLPPGWDGGAQVEVLDEDGNGTGSFVDPWRIGNAGDANANGYLPVPDVPVWNSFVMANDDADPCDCDMDAIALRSPAIDLSTATNTGIEFRAYHDGLFNGGALRLQAGTDGSAWADVLEITERTGQWQHVIGDLGPWDGEPVVYVRFTWTDNEQWATGVALDDVCIFDRADHDLAILTSMTGDPQVDPLDEGPRSLHYSAVPVSQAGPVTLSAIVINRGAQDATQVMLNVDLFQDGVPQGSFASDPVASLAPGTVDTIVLHSSWTPSVVGMVSAEMSVVAADADDEPANNDAIVMQWITGMGTAAGNGAMAVDNDIAEGSHQLGTTERSVGNRFELLGNGSSIHAVSALLDPTSTVGAIIQGRILDELFNEISLTEEDTITQAELDAAASGIPVFLLLDEPLTMDEDQDVHALVGSVNGSSAVSIKGGGFVDRGTSVYWEPVAGILEFLQRPPIVRLHFDVPAVSVNEVPMDRASIRIIPQPANDRFEVHWEGGNGTVTVLDTQGRAVAEEAGHDGRLVLDASSWAAGSYCVLVQGSRSVATSPLFVVH